MNLADMRAIVRRDLHDEDSGSYRWTNDEIDRHILRAVKEYSQALPREQRATLSTTAGSREIGISSLSDRVTVQAVEYPVGGFPPLYQRFSVWGDTLTLLGRETPDGSNALVYYGSLHTLGASSSTIPAPHEDLVATGACGYAATAWAVYAINRVNTGGAGAAEGLLRWGKDRLDAFHRELKRLGRRNRVRVSTLYQPYAVPVSQTTDPGP